MRIAVIGAGIAGLYCGYQLTQKKHDVTVFEKSRGRGGRMAVKRLQWGELDIGAQYFTARDDEFCGQVANWQQQGLVQRWQFQPHRLTPQGLVTSPDDEQRFVGTPGMNSVPKYLASKTNLKLETRISRMTFESNLWQVFDEKDILLGLFDWVIVALPAEQAAELIADQSRIGNMIPSPTHLPCWALGLVTKGEVAPDIQGVFGDNTVSWLSRLSSKPARSAPRGSNDVWMLHFSPETSAHLVADDVLAKGGQWLINSLRTELEVVHHYQHFWRYATTQQGNKLGPLIDQKKRIAAIGDWTFGGRVEGAFLSAQKFVNQVFE